VPQFNFATVSFMFGMPISRWHALSIYWILPLALLAAGCSSDDHVSLIAASNKSNIQRLTNCYAAFQMNSYGLGPKDEAEFRRFINNDMGKYHLKLMDIDLNNIDGIFVSERDHLPFLVKYGIKGGPGIVDALVFEQKGRSGIRQVGINGGKIMNVDDSQYQEMWEGRWHQPKKSGDPDLILP
jgi:hypothetical protein